MKTFALILTFCLFAGLGVGEEKGWLGGTSECCNLPFEFTCLGCGSHYNFQVGSMYIKHHICPFQSLEARIEKLEAEGGKDEEDWPEVIADIMYPDTE